MMSILAILVGKITFTFTRWFRKGGGTALPGLLALKIDKNILTKLTKNLKYGAVIITGTNGKTTTAKMLVDILKSAGMDVITNNSGSNLSRGLVSILIHRTSFTGKKTKGDVGVFEIDEATMIEAVPMLNPKIIAVTNLFRDQLDRYGEIDKTASIISSALEGTEAKIILNADDPIVTSLDKKKKATYFGIEDSEINDKSNLDNDNRDCPLCGTPLKYSLRYFSHIGKYTCPKCDFKRPSPENTIFEIKLDTEKTTISLHTASKENIEATLNVPGFYNVYNALAASSLATALGVTGENIKKGLESSAAAFGRMEKIQVKDKFIYLLLVKNPTGFTESLKSVLSDGKINILLALNDNFADGTDVSWIWDAEIELLKDKTKSIAVSGIRAEDMALRLKYADIPMETVDIESNIIKSLEKTIENIPAGETLYVLPTYTAMMDIRNVLVKLGYIKPFWN